MNSYITVLKKYAVFTGRASRKEFWMFILINFIITMILMVGEVALGGPGIAGMLYSLVVLLPSIGVAIRRMHDTNRSGWWILTWFLPLIGIAFMVFFGVQDSQAGDNQYGPNPKGL